MLPYIGVFSSILWDNNKYFILNVFLKKFVKSFQIVYYVTFIATMSFVILLFSVM